MKIKNRRNYLNEHILHSQILLLPTFCTALIASSLYTQFSSDALAGMENNKSDDAMLITDDKEDVVGSSHE